MTCSGLYCPRMQLPPGARAQPAISYRSWSAPGPGGAVLRQAVDLEDGHGPVAVPGSANKSPAIRAAVALSYSWLTWSRRASPPWPCSGWQRGSSRSR